MADTLVGALVRAAVVPVAIAAGMTGLATPCRAEPVAIITDVTGKAALQGGGKRNVSILSDLDRDARLQLASGARAVVLYTNSGAEYLLTGPALIQFRSIEPIALSGAKPQKRASPLGGGVTIKPTGVTQAGFLMRSGRITERIKLITLSDTKTLDSKPRFRWVDVEPGAVYRFELTDDSGKLVYETTVAGDSLILPSKVSLRDGVNYTWEISTRMPDGRRFVGAGDFSVVPATLRSKVETLRPAVNAPVSSRVVFATWLEQMELKDEARKYWKQLASERPEDSKLKALATNE